MDAATESDELYWFSAHLFPAFINDSAAPAIVAATPLPPLPRQPGATHGAGAGAGAGAGSVDAAVAAAAAALAASDAVLVVAGAGMGVDSGLPSFRGRKGWYTAGPTASFKMEDVDFHDDAKITLAFGYQMSMLRAFLSKRPHAGFAALRRLLARHGAADSFVFTSNIDSYFARAGFDAARLYESHGSFAHLQCTSMGDEARACTAELWPAGYGADDGSGDNDDGNANDANGDVGKGGSDGGGGGGGSGGNGGTARRPLPPVDPTSLRCARADLPRCCDPSCGRLARFNVSHLTDEDRHIVQTRKGAQARALRAWLCGVEDRLFGGSNASGGAGGGGGGGGALRGLTILEVGCGTSVHSLRDESELLLRRLRVLAARCSATKRAPPAVSLVRIDPGAPSAAGSGAIHVRLGARDALLRIEEAVNAGTK